MSRRTCRYCGADVGSAEFSTCGRHACQRAAMGLPTAPPDDLGELLTGIDEPEPQAPAPTPPDAALLRAQLDESARRRELVWLTGQISLLRRCATFGPEARPQSR